MNKIIELWHKIVHNEWFIRVISLLIAVVLWLYIVNIADQKREKEFTDVPVTYVFEGTVPYENGLMMLLANKTFYVDITVSGSRSDLMNFSRDGITATLNFNSVAAEGIYNVPLSIKLSNENLFYEINGDEFITVEFVKRGTVTVPVDYTEIGSYASGYEVINQSVTPSSITVTGPKSVTDTIASASVSVDVNGLKDNIVTVSDINLYTSGGSYVDRTYLTLSSSQSTVSLNLAYRKTVKLTYSVANNFGGNESYITTSISPSQYVRLEGSEDILSNISSYDIGQISLENIQYDGQTVTFPLVLPAGISLVTEYDSFDVTVNLNGAETRIVTLDSESLSKCLFENLSSGMSARINDESVKVLIRALPFTLDSLNSSSYTLSVDMASPNEEGLYPLTISFNDGIYAGLMGQYYVSVNTFMGSR